MLDNVRSGKGSNYMKKFIFFPLCRKTENLTRVPKFGLWVDFADKL